MTHSGKRTSVTWSTEGDCHVATIVVEQRVRLSIPRFGKDDTDPGLEVIDKVDIFAAEFDSAIDTVTRPVVDSFSHATHIMSRLFSEFRDMLSDQGELAETFLAGNPQKPGKKKA